MIAVIATLFKLYLISGQTFSPEYKNIHDQVLYVHLANEIIKGQWMGPYGQLTLYKPPFYPLWIAFIHLMHFPLMLANQLLYLSACAVFVKAIKPLVNSRTGLTLVYIFLIFNPYSYSRHYMLDIRCENIYSSLTIMVVSLGLGLWVRVIRRDTTVPLWSFGLGVALAAFWLTRPENVWILPFFIILIIASFLMMKMKPRTLIIPIILPLIICSLLSAAVALTNLVNYGIFTTCDYTTKEFSAAYGAMLRVKQEKFNVHTPLPTKTRLKIAEFSPSLKEVEPYLEKIDIQGTYSYDPRNSFLGSLIVPVFRMAVSWAGYYDSYKSSAGFYRKLSLEINDACSSAKLECDAPRQSIFPAWQSNYTKSFIQNLEWEALNIIEFNNLDPWPHIAVPPSGGLRSYLKVTGAKFIFSHRRGLTLKKISLDDVKKISILDRIGHYWQQIIIPLSLLAGGAYVIMLWTSVRRGKYTTELIIASAILTALITRVAFVAYLDTMLWPMPRMLSCAFPLLLMFISFVLLNTIIMISSFKFHRYDQTKIK